MNCPAWLRKGTVAEALDIARDVTRKLIEARRERDDFPDLSTITKNLRP